MLSANQGNAATIAEFVGHQLREHAVTRAFHAAVPPSGSISVDDFKSLFVGQVHGRSQKTLDNYFNSFFGWLMFSGIVELRAGRVIRPAARSVQLGVLRATRREKIIGFMAASEPDKVIAAASRLTQGRLRRDTIPRNVGTDLLGLQLAYYDGAHVCAHRLLRPRLSHAAVKQTVLQQAEQSPFLLAHRSIRDPSLSTAEEGHLLGELLGREWSHASAQRYASAARRWQRAIATSANGRPQSKRRPQRART